jgi:hypothetical protein
MLDSTSDENTSGVYTADSADKAVVQDPGLGMFDVETTKDLLQVYRA